MYLTTSGSIGETPTGMARGLGQIDLSTLSWEDYLLLGIGAMVVFNLVSPGSRVFGGGGGKRKSSGKRKGSGGGGLGYDLAIIGVLGAAWIGYLYFSGSGSTS